MLNFKERLNDQRDKCPGVKNGFLGRGTFNAKTVTVSDKPKLMVSLHLLSEFRLQCV